MGDCALLIGAPKRGTFVGQCLAHRSRTRKLRKESRRSFDVAIDRQLPSRFSVETELRALEVVVQYAARINPVSVNEGRRRIWAID